MIECPEMVWDSNQQRIGIILPVGVTVEKITHQVLGSHGIRDPLDLRERVLILLKVGEDE